MAEKKSELDALDPIGERVAIRGEEVHIVPIKVGKVPALVRAIGEIAPAISRMEDTPMEQFVVELIGTHGEAVLNALSICAGKDRAFIDDLTLDELLPLARAVFGVNRDFFSMRVAPLIKEMMGPSSTDSASPSSP